MSAGTAPLNGVSQNTLVTTVIPCTMYMFSENRKGIMKRLKDLNIFMCKENVCLKKGSESSDHLFVTPYTLTIYPSVHTQLRTLFEAHIVYCISV